jgi:hypothetical protein
VFSERILPIVEPLRLLAVGLGCTGVSLEVPVARADDGDLVFLACHFFYAAYVEI